MNYASKYNFQGGLVAMPLYFSLIGTMCHCFYFKMLSVADRLHRYSFYLHCVGLDALYLFFYFVTPQQVYVLLFF